MYEQSLTLVEGWNALYLEVQPEPADLATVFAGLPVLGVFTPSASATVTEYIQDPSEELVQDPGWRWWFPDPPQSVLTNLYTVLPNRAYLVRLGPLPGGASQIQLKLSGPPRFEAMRWQPDGFTLTGLPVDPAAPPTFAQFFSASAAHADVTLYRLVDGSWSLVQPTDTVQSGEAYYVYTKSSSSYAGPLKIDLDEAQALSFGRITQVLRPKLAPLASTSVQLRLLPSADPVVLAYRRLDPGSGSFVWENIPSSLSIPVETAGNQTQVQLAARRDQFSADRVASVLEITDGVGTRRLIPVSAEVLHPASTRRGSALAAFPGLWLGSVTVDKVSQTQSGGSTTPIPTAKPFQFRILIHVDGSDQARLLKQVIQLWQEGTVNPDGSTTSRPVLVTDDFLISNFSGITVRDGVPVGQRISTLAFDFPGTELPMTGSVNLGSTVSALIEIAPDHPTNPFRHPFHPDHDNLATDFSTPAAEALAVTRQIELEFDSVSSSPSHPPEFGVTLLEGTYRETVSGLHRNDIHAEGRFELRNIALVEVLNE